MTRVQVAGAIAALVLAAASLGASILRSPDVPFLLGDANARWIGNDRPVALETHLAGRQFAPRAEFTRSFRVERVPKTATLAVEALGEVQVAVNGRAITLPAEDRACFKRICSAAVAAFIGPGENTIRAQVRNPTGPPLLQLHLRGDGLEVATDERWQVALDEENAES